METAEEGTTSEVEEVVETGETTAEPEVPAEETTETPTTEATDEVVVTIGEDSPPSDEDETKAPEWVRELRKSHRTAQARIRELEAAQAKAPEAPQALGAKPKLEDYDYDAERFGQELESWHERKRVADDLARKRQEDENAAEAAWQAKLDSYGEAKAKLKVKDMEDAEEAARSVLNVTQQGVILQGADNPALLIYALGKNPKKAKELASITDPVKFAFAVAKLETQVKATPRKAPPPEGQVKGSAPISGAIDSTLQRLRAEAEKTGDYSKVTAHRNAQRKKAA